MARGKKIITLADNTTIEVGVRFKDLTGQVFGRLTVISLSSGDVAARWNCRCSCGTAKIVNSGSLLSGASKSCGCYSREVTGNTFRTHGLRGSKEYNNWTNMRVRCCDEGNPNYTAYGGAGITLCERWRNSFAAFIEDMGRHPNTEEDWSIDRIDNHLGYFKENCRWATNETQSRNHTKRSDNSSGTTGIHYNEVKNAWIAQWCSLDRKRKAASYSVKKYGAELARFLAEERRDIEIRRLNLQGAGYADNHGK